MILLYDIFSFEQVDQVRTIGTSEIASNDFAIVVMSGSRTTLYIDTYILPKCHIPESDVTADDRNHHGLQSLNPKLIGKAS